MGKDFGELKEDSRRIDKRLVSLEQDVRQPRLAMEADFKAGKNIRERTEGAAMLKFKRSMGIAVLLKGSKPADKFSQFRRESRTSSSLLQG